MRLKQALRVSSTIRVARNSYAWQPEFFPMESVTSPWPSASTLVYNFGSQVDFSTNSTNFPTSNTSLICFHRYRYRLLQKDNGDE